MRKADISKKGIKMSRGTKIFSITCLLSVLFICSCADQIIFQPPTPSYHDGPGIIRIETQDGESISAVYLKSENSRYTILYSHGNAEDLGQIAGHLKEFVNRGYSVLAYDYRGYGTSEGKASEANTYKDIDAAFDYLVKSVGVEPERIILLGRSVGGGPSVNLASKREVGGLILESSFISVYGVVSGFSSGWLDKFDNINKIRRVKCPVLIMHGTNDRIIKFDHGQKLYKVANEPKMKLWVEGAGHNNLSAIAGSRYWEAIDSFAEMVYQKERREVRK